MMKNIFPILLLILSNVMFAQEAKHDATFIEIVQEYTLNEDGSQDYHYYKKFELNTHFSFNRLYGETFIVYNPEHQELKIKTGTTILIINDPTNGECFFFLIYSNLNRFTYGIFTAK